MRKRSWFLSGFLLGLVAAHSAVANPTGPQVVHGTVTITQPNAHTTQVTNTPNAIINWQSFSVGANETTRFVQQSAASAVMNRVVGVNPSEILGNLVSNGQVFLINPNGLVFGAGAVVDTAAFVGSTLNMTDADFLAGRLRFEGESAGAIRNHGLIKARDDGGIYLVAPEVENDGIIKTEDGRILLAAGRKLTVSSLDVQHISFEIQAPADSVVNLGELLTGNGSVGMFASRVHNAGRIRASGVARDASGQIVLTAGTGGLELSASSDIAATRGGDGGDVTIDGGAAAVIAGTVAASGTDGTGGAIDITADDVTVEAATVDASGSAGGGRVRIGGEFQGGKALAADELRNANNVTVARESQLLARTTGTDGDGGEVIVWADQITRYYGHIDARPGSASGAGGQAEVSGAAFLRFDGTVQTGVDDRLGRLLLDPKNIIIDAGGSGISGNLLFTDTPSTDTTINANALATLLGGQAVTLQANNDITLNAGVDTTGGGITGKLTMQAGRSVLLNAQLNTDEGDVEIVANEKLSFGVQDADRDAGAAGITMSGASGITTTGNVTLIVDDDLTKTNNTSGDVAIQTVNAGHVLIEMRGSTDNSSVFTNVGGSITATTVFVEHAPNNGGSLGTGGGIGLSGQPLVVNASNFAGHTHHAGDVNVSLTNDGTTIIGGTVLGTSTPITGVKTGADQGSGDISIVSIGSIEVIDDIQAAGNGSVTLSAGTDGTGDLSFNMTQALLDSDADNSLLVHAGSTGSNTGTMLLEGQNVNFIGGDGASATTTIDTQVFGSGTMTVRALSGDVALTAGTGGGGDTSTINIIAGSGTSGTDTGGAQVIRALGDIRVQSAIGEKALDVNIEARNAAQTLDAGADITLQAGDASGSQIDVLASGSASATNQQTLLLNAGAASTVGRLTLDAGAAGTTGGTDNRVVVSSNGTQSVTATGADSGISVRGDATTSTPTSIFSAIGAGGNQTIIVEGVAGFVLEAGGTPALVTSGATQTVTVGGASTGGLTLQPSGSGTKETRMEATTQIINADFIQLFAGTDGNADVILKANGGNQTINITTSTGQSFSARGGTSGSGSAIQEAAGAISVTNTGGDILYGVGTSTGPTTITSAGQTFNGQNVRFQGGQVSATSNSGGNINIDASLVAEFSTSIPGETVSINAAGDLNVIGDSINVNTGSSGSNTVTIQANSISSFDTRTGGLTIQAGNGNSAGIQISSNSTFDIDVAGILGVDAGGNSSSVDVTSAGDFTIDANAISINSGSGGGSHSYFESTGGSMDVTTAGVLSLTATNGLGGNDIRLRGATGFTSDIGGNLTMTGATSPGSGVEIGATGGSAVVDTAGNLTMTAGSGDGSGARVQGSSISVEVGNNMTLAGGGGNSSSADIDSSSVLVDVVNNLSLTGGSGTDAGARIGSGSTSASVTIGDGSSIGGTVTLTGGGGSGAEAAIGSGCTSGPCNADVTINSVGTITLSGSKSFLGSDTAFTADTGGSITLNSTSGNVTLNDGSLKTPGAVNITAQSTTQSSPTGSIKAGSLNVSATSGVMLNSTSNDVASFSATVSSTGDIDFTNDGTIETTNSSDLALGPVSTTDGSVDISEVTGSINGAGSITAGGSSSTVDIVASAGNISLAGNVSGSDDVNIDALSGGINVAGSLTSTAAGVFVTGNSTVSVVGPVNADSQVQMSSAAGNLTLGSSVTSTTSSITLSGSQNLSVSGAVSAGGAVNLSATTGTTTLSGGVSTTSGFTTLSGTAGLNFAGGVSGASTVSLTSGSGSIEGTGTVTGSSVQLNAFTGSVGAVSPIQLGTSTITINAANSVGINIVGGGLTLSPLTLAGNLNVIADGMILQIGALSVAGLTTIDAGTNVINLSSVSNVFSGGLELTGSNITIGGSGTLNLSDTDFSAGGTFGGFSALSTSGDVRLASGATLSTGGADFINNGGLILEDLSTINLGGGEFTNNGSISPGNSPGTTTIIGDVTFTGSSVYEAEVADDGSSDLLVVNGTLTLGGELEVQPLDFFAGDPDIDFEIIQCTVACVGDFSVVSADPATVIVETFPEANSYVVTTTPADDSLDPTDGLLSELDLLEELEALEEELFESELELALDEDGDGDGEDDDELPEGTLICL